MPRSPKLNACMCRLMTCSLSSINICSSGSSSTLTERSACAGCSSPQSPYTLPSARCCGRHISLRPKGNHRTFQCHAKCRFQEHARKPEGEPQESFLAKHFGGGDSIKLLHRVARENNFDVNLNLECLWRLPIQ